MTAALLRANRRTFSSLRKHRNYRLFFTGQVISVTGTWMQNIATAWLILTLTHSAFAVGVLAMCQFLPFTLFALVAGFLADRFDPRRLVITTQLAAMAVAVALATLTLSGLITVWEVFVLAALGGVVRVFDAPSRQALTFQMVGRDELPNAVALNSSLFNAARIIGPAAGGVIVAMVGVGWCFALNAASFLAVLASLLAIRVADLFPLARSEKQPTMLGGTRAAFAYVVRARRPLVVLVIVFLVSTFSFNFNVLLPVLAHTTMDSGPRVFGILSACFGGGALAGALLSASLGRASRTALLVGTGGFGAAQLLLAPARSVAVAGVLLAVAGLCFTLWTSNANSTLQLGAPDHLRGRVIGLYYFAFGGAGPIGGLLTGWLAASGGTALAFAFAGGVALLTTAGALLLRSPAIAPRLVPAPQH